MEDIKSYPINYNHYYTDTIKKRRRDRDKEALSKCLQQSITDTRLFPDATPHMSSTTIDIGRALDQYCSRADPEMEKHGCEEAFDCLFSIYKPSPFSVPFATSRTDFPFSRFLKKRSSRISRFKVIERHLVRGLEKIFSPVTVDNLSESDSQAIASEPSSAKRHREFLDDRI